MRSTLLLVAVGAFGTLAAARDGGLEPISADTFSNILYPSDDLVGVLVGAPPEQCGEICVRVMRMCGLLWKNGARKGAERDANLHVACCPRTHDSRTTHWPFKRVARW